MKTQLKLDLADILTRKFPKGFHAPADIDIGLFLEFADDEWEHELDIDIHELLDPQHAIALIWDTEQVRSRYSYLTENQAWEVLRKCEQDYDAARGLNWDDIAATVAEIHPDPTDDLKERIGRFELTVMRYNGEWSETDNLVDLLTDARHWCDAHDLNFEDAVSTADQHYLAELNGTE